MNKSGKTRLRDLAYARSGDKGAHANIGVIAYSKEAYDILLKNLKEDDIVNFFSKLPITKVIKYELPNLLALNFVFHGALGDGGSRSLKSDAQGKALGQAILEMEIKIDRTLIMQEV